MSSSQDNADAWAEHEDALDRGWRRADMNVTFVCGPSSMHPFECDGPGRCVHCDRTVSANHDPGACDWCLETAVAG